MRANKSPSANNQQGLGCFPVVFMPEKMFHGGHSKRPKIDLQGFLCFSWAEMKLCSSGPTKQRDAHEGDGCWTSGWRPTAGRGRLKAPVATQGEIRTRGRKVCLFLHHENKPLVCRTSLLVGVIVVQSVINENKAPSTASGTGGSAFCSLQSSNYALRSWHFHRNTVQNFSGHLVEEHNSLLSGRKQGRSLWEKVFQQSKRLGQWLFQRICLVRDSQIVRLRTWLRLSSLASVGWKNPESSLTWLCWGTTPWSLESIAKQLRTIFHWCHIAESLCPSVYSAAELILCTRELLSLWCLRETQNRCLVPFSHS